MASKVDYLKEQVNFLQFHLEDFLGKRIQVIIYYRNSSEGHCLFAIDNHFLQVQYEDYIYLIWKVKLI